MFNYEIIKNLNDLELSLYRYIMKNIEKVIYMRIRELADGAHVSTTTILRFCKKLNCEGYSEFKVKLKMELENNDSLNVSNDTSAVIDFLKKLDNDEVEEKIDIICELINKSNNIVLIGSGTSGILCKYAARYFSAIGKISMYIDDPSFPTNYKFYESCTVIVLSVSGENSSIINKISNLKRENCTIVSITNSANSTISKISDLNISYYVKEEKLGISDITTQMPVLFLIESIGKKFHSNYLIDKN